MQLLWTSINLYSKGMAGFTNRIIDIEFLVGIRCCYVYYSLRTKQTEFNVVRQKNVFYLSISVLFNLLLFF